MTWESNWILERVKRDSKYIEGIAFDVEGGGITGTILTSPERLPNSLYGKRVRIRLEVIE